MATHYWLNGWRICTGNVAFTTLGHGWCQDFAVPFISDAVPSDFTAALTDFHDAWVPKLTAILTSNSIIRTVSFQEVSVSGSPLTGVVLPGSTSPTSGNWGNDIVSLFLPYQNTLCIKKRAAGGEVKDKGRFFHTPINGGIMASVVDGTIDTTNANVLAFADMFKTPIVCNGVTFKPAIRHRVGGWVWEEVQETEVQQAICVKRNRRIIRPS